MSAVAISVARRSKFDGVIDRIERTGTRTSFMAFGEESRTDEFAVTVFGGKSDTGFACTFPAARNGTEVKVGEATTLRPYAGVEDSDDDVRTVVGLRPEAALVAEAKELRGASGVKLTAAVLEDGED